MEKKSKKVSSVNQFGARLKQSKNMAGAPTREAKAEREEKIG